LQNFEGGYERKKNPSYQNLNKAGMREKEKLGNYQKDGSLPNKDG